MDKHIEYLDQIIQTELNNALNMGVLEKKKLTILRDIETKIKEMANYVSLTVFIEVDLPWITVVIGRQQPIHATIELNIGDELNLTVSILALLDSDFIMEHNLESFTIDEFIKYIAKFLAKDAIAARQKELTTEIGYHKEII